MPSRTVPKSATFAFPFWSSSTFAVLRSLWVGDGMMAVRMMCWEDNRITAGRVTLLPVDHLRREGVQVRQRARHAAGDLHPVLPHQGSWRLLRARRSAGEPPVQRPARAHFKHEATVRPVHREGEQPANAADA
jgi:hypothetical protein